MHKPFQLCKTVKNDKYLTKVVANLKNSIYNCDCFQANCEKFVNKHFIWAKQAKACDAKL